MPKKPYAGNFRKRMLGAGVSGGKGSATGLPVVGGSPQGNYEQKTRYPKAGGKNSRPNSRK